MKSQWEHLPIFKKAEEIRAIVDSIFEIVSKSEMHYSTESEGNMIDDSLNFLINNSLLIPAKIAGASGKQTLYALQMENATLIRKAARELILDIGTIEDFGFKDIEYLDLLRIEVDKFRILFAEWVKTFDPWNYTIDLWGLFNPPGINYDDYNSEDDIELNNDYE